MACAASIDQMYARRVGRVTPIPSLQLCLEDNSLTGACAASYSCAYTHTISGSPMGDSHVHDHRFLPLLLAGHGNGTLQGGTHLRRAEDTPMANLLLTLLDRLGVKLDRIGDSTGDLAI